MVGSASTSRPHENGVTRRKMGTCGVSRSAYLGSYGDDQAELIRGCVGVAVRADRPGRADDTSGVDGPVIRWPTGPNSWSQSRAPATPIWRLGVQCERAVRDPTRFAALARTNQVGWPSGLGISQRGLESPYRSEEPRWRLREERRRKPRLRWVRVWDGRASPGLNGRPFFCACPILPLLPPNVQLLAPGSWPLAPSS